jgi:hypothetical protein
MTTQRLFLQRIILLLMAAVIFSHSAMAQNATANATAKIAEGRAKLALQTPTGCSSTHQRAQQSGS